MGEQVLSGSARRISLPAFSSDLGKEVPNYLRASLGSCHDFCKYGKDTALIRQNRPRIKNDAPASSLDLGNGVPKVRSARVPKINASNKKSEILSEAHVSEDKSSEKEIKPSKVLPTTSEAKLSNKKSLAKKTGVTSGSVKLEKLKGVVPTNVGSPDLGRNSLNLQVVGKGNGNGNKRTAKIVSSSSVGSKHDTVTKSPIHPPKKLNAVTRPPLSPSPSKLAIKGKTPSSSTPPPLMPIAKSRPRSSPNQLKAKGVAVHSPSPSDTKKIKAATLKAQPPSAPRNASSKQSLNFKGQNAKKGVASKTRVSKDVATRRGSIPHKSKTVTNLTGKELQPEKIKESHEKEEEEPSRAAELGNQEVMESYDEVPEKTLYVVEMETGNIAKPYSFDEDEPPEMQLSAALSPPHWPTSPTHSSSSTLQNEGVQCEMTNTDKTPPSAEEKTSDVQPFASFSQPIQPSSPSSITGSSNTSSQYAASKDVSTYTGSEVDNVSHEDDHLVDAEDLKGADNTKLKKSPTISSQEFNKDPVKLEFRRGRVVDITQENNDGRRRLNFRREHVLEENTAQDEVRKISFKKVEATQDSAATRENSVGTVVLRHQDMKDKKDAQGLFNNVIEKTASKLAETRKSKVKALVGAFETVISLQDGKPAATS